MVRQSESESSLAMGILAKFGRIFLKIIAIIFIFITSGFAFDAYKAHPVKTFCSELSETASSENVLALASDKGLPAFQDKGTVTVLNQLSPFFRHACVINFDNGRQIEKRFITAD